LRIWLTPVGFIQAALAAPNAAVTDRYVGREDRTVKVVAFTTKVCDGPQPQCTRRVTGEFNKDNMLERVVTWVPDPVLGDKMVEFRWSEYRDVGGGVKMPFHVHAHMGDHPLIPGGHNYLDLRISDIKVNVANSATAVPDAVRNAPLPTQNRVVSTQLAPGVVLLGGGSHNSVAVEFKDFVTVIEGPLSNQRTNAVVAEVHKLFPNKPIKYLVNTHNHFDNMLIAYLPKEKIVVNADLYGPPPAGGNIQNVNANAVALYRNIKRLKLDVNQHVPIHGNPGSNADFERIVGPVAARAPQQGGGG